MRSPQDVDVDILFGKYPWLDEALANPEKDPVGYPTIGLPYLIMLKLVANRGRDLSDLYILLGWAEDVQLNQIRKVVSRYMPEEKDDLESLIFIGQHEQKDSPDWNPTTQ